MTRLLTEVNMAGQRMLHDVDQQVRAQCHDGRAVSPPANRIGEEIGERHAEHEPGRQRHEKGKNR
jgi:hypothetical protein